MGVARGSKHTYVNVIHLNASLSLFVRGGRAAPTYANANIRTIRIYRTSCTHTHIYGIRFLFNPLLGRAARLHIMLSHQIDAMLAPLTGRRYYSKALSWGHILKSYLDDGTAIMRDDMSLGCTNH